MRLKVLFCAVLLSGCSVGEATRWVGADNKIVAVENIPYQVIWVRDATGIDMRSVRTGPGLGVFMPDAMIERRRATEAAMMVGTELCGGKASLVAETNSGDLNNTRVKCG